MDKFQEMRAFVTVVDTGSFVRAADALSSSKTAVSRLVGEMESRLGTRLLRISANVTADFGDRDRSGLRCVARPAV